MQGDVQPPSNGEDRLEGEGFQDEGNDGGAEAENLAEDEEFAEGQPPEGLPGHRLTRRQVLIGGAIAGGALLGGGAGAIYLLLRSDGDEDQVAGERPTRATETPAPTEVPTQAPTPTATVPPRPRLEYVEDAPGSIEERDWANGELIDWNHGLFAMNVNTGAVHGWRVAQGWSHVKMPYSTYRFLGQGRYVAATLSDYSYVLDRETGAAVRMPARALYPELAGPEHVLIADVVPLPEENSYSPPVRTGGFAVTDADWSVTSRFELVSNRWSTELVLSPDGNKLAAVTGDTREAAEVEVVDLATGQHHEVFRPPDQISVMVAQDTHVASATNGEFLVTSWYGYPRPGGGTSGGLHLNRAISWQGNPTEKVVWSDPFGLPHFAADGSFVRRQQLYKSLGAYDWPAAVVHDAQWNEVWRIRSAEPGEWLADGSGFVGAIHRTPADPRAQYVVVSRDGRSMEALPRATPADVYGERWPSPSPVNPALYSFNGTHVFDRTSGLQFSANLRFPKSVGLGFPCWTGRPGEMTFRMPMEVMNFGEQQPPILGPVLERTPFIPQPSIGFRVSGTGSCLNVRATPEADADVLACLPDGHWLHLDTLSQLHLAYREPERWGRYRETWVRVTDGSVNGWVLSDYLAWDVP